MKTTIAKCVFVHEGKQYLFEYDYEEDYPFDAANYMFTEGNYSCDCNRSAFVQEKYPEFPELDCGEKIELVELVIYSKEGPEINPDPSGD